MRQANEGLGACRRVGGYQPNRLDAAFREELFARTEGHPLFTVELLRTLEERGDLVKDAGGRWVQSASLDWDTIPARVEGVIAERLGWLTEEARETLTVGSVHGAVFRRPGHRPGADVSERERLVKQLARRTGQAALPGAGNGRSARR